MQGSRLQPPMSRRAIVLVVALAVLSALALLATVFALMARMERNVAAASVEVLRARELSLAGVDFAVSRLRDTTGLATVDDPRMPPYRWGQVRKAGAASPAPTVAWPSRTVFGDTVTGELAATYAGGADAYSLTVVDVASRLPLDATHPFLARMLDVLGAAIGAERADGLDPVRGRGAQILALRDSLGGFHAREELRRLLSEADYQALAPYVGLHAWTDPTTASVVPGHQADAEPPLVRAPRPPVDVNTAPVPVLCAILTGVASTASDPVPFNIALRVAREIVRVREGNRPGEGPLADVGALRLLLESLSAHPTAWLTPQQAEALVADLDPNLTLSRLNPERVIRRPIDKCGLTYWTLEACFRSMGRYEVESVGRVYRGDGLVVAEARTSTVVEVYGVLRATLQKEFESGRVTTAADGSITLPEPTVVAPSEWSGYVQLRPATPPPGPGPSFLATFDDSFDPLVGQPPLAAPATGDVLSRGRLFPDGAAVRTSDDDVLCYAASPHLPPDEGTLEMWVKLDESASLAPEPIWFASLPLTRDIFLEHRISVGACRDVLTVQSVRTFAVADSYGAGRTEVPCPYALDRTELDARVQGAGVANEWHHLSITWSDGTDQRLYVDGRPVGAQAGARVRKGVRQKLQGPGLDAFWVGGAPQRLGGEEPRWTVVPSCNLTLDDLAIYPSASIRDPRGFLPPDRFARAQGSALGVFEGTFPALPFAARFETVTWTEWDPAEYEGKPLARGSVEVKFGLYQPGRGGPPPGRAKKGMGRKDLQALGLPQVLVANDEIRYRLEFVSPAVLTPMNVTPIVDDLEITYQGPPRFLSWQEE